MDKRIYFKKYAEAVLKIGVNLQPGEILLTTMPTEYRELGVEITKQAFEMGAKDVVITWVDEEVEHYRMLGADEETLSQVNQYEIDKIKYYMEKECCSLVPCIFYPDLNLDVPAAKIKAAEMHRRTLRKIERDYRNSEARRWAAFVIGNPAWAKKLYPDMEEEERNDLFFKQVAKIVRIDEDSDPVDNWKKHCEDLSRYSKWLNEQNFDRIHITTGLGTDVVIGLVKGHIWCSAAEMGDVKTIPYCANMPTEEIFTAPDLNRADGIVYASRPLFLSGRMVEDFWIKFENGRVIDSYAAKEHQALIDLMNIEESCRHLGELALVPDSSPISQTNMNYYFVPLDENAASHMALGTSFPSCIKGGSTMSREDLLKAGVNYAPIHNDFMYGTRDMVVTGIKPDGIEVIVMKNGEFVI